MAAQTTRQAAPARRRPAPLTGGEIARRIGERGARRILDATADVADDYDPDEKE